MDMFPFSARRRAGEGVMLPLQSVQSGSEVISVSQPTPSHFFKLWGCWSRGQERVCFFLGVVCADPHLSRIYKMHMYLKTATAMTKGPLLCEAPSAWVLLAPTSRHASKEVFRMTPTPVTIYMHFRERPPGQATRPCCSLTPDPQKLWKITNYDCMPLCWLVTCCSPVTVMKTRAMHGIRVLKAVFKAEIPRWP